MKRIVTAVLLLCLPLALFAAGTQAVENSEAGIEISAPGVYPVVSQPVTLTMLVPQRLGNTPDWATNSASVHMEEHTGVHIEYEVAPDFNQARTLAIASGEYPDMIMGASIPSSDIMKNGPKGIYIALNDLIEEQGVWAKKMFADDPAIKQVSTTPDGNIYGLPGVNDDLHGVYGPKTWINRVWLERLGLEMPTTTDEFYNVLKAFKEKDPNQNGKADEVPYSGGVTGWRAQIPGAVNNAFLYVNINTKGLYLDNGRVAYAFVQPKYRESLRYHAKLYREGLIDPAAFTQEGNQLKQLGENPGVEILGASEGGWWNVFTINGGESGHYKMYDIVPPLKGPDGFQTSGFYKYKVNKDTFVITKANKYPTVAIKWADYIYQPEGAWSTQYGPEGIGWRRAKAGEIGINGKPALYERLRAQEQENFNWGFIGPRYQPIPQRLGDLRAPMERYWEPATLMTRLAGVEMQKYVGIEPPDDMIMPPVYLNEEQSSEISLAESAIDSYKKEATVRFIIGELDIETDWDDYVKELEKAGLARFLELYQEGYDAQFK